MCNAAMFVRVGGRRRGGGGSIAHVSVVTYASGARNGVVCVRMVVVCVEGGGSLI